jgi:hypothetical protein
VVRLQGGHMHACMHVANLSCCAGVMLLCRHLRLLVVVLVVRSVW